MTLQITLATLGVIWAIVALALFTWGLSINRTLLFKNRAGLKLLGVIIFWPITVPVILFRD